jgi:uncharacterized protein YdiU (UPF0061 family)
MPLTNLASRFVDSLPGDPQPANFIRQVRACYSRVDPTPVAAPRLLAHSAEVAESLGLMEADMRDETLVAVLGGSRLLPGMKPYAACYGGHQFGSWAGQLGDGRAITLCEVRHAGASLEVQLKGAGPTPYSRRADGRAVLRSSVREFLCSEAMAHLGVPTTRALSLVATGEPVVRDMLYDGNARPEPGAVVARVAPSFLRFGSYQIHAARQDTDTLAALVEHTLSSHFPHLGPLSPESCAAWLTEVCRRTAVMVVHWMRVGFVHGVMNTDNMSVLGLTIDYGPYGWLDVYDHDWTPNTTDAGGRRYRFGYQPRIAGWNLARFAESLYPIIGDVPPLEAALEVYADTLAAGHDAMMRDKLGLTGREEGDDALFRALLEALQEAETDMTIFYRRLSRLDPADPTPDHFTEAFYADSARPKLADWLRRYARRVTDEGRDAGERRAAMDAVNPKYVLRNYLAAEAIDAAEAGDPGLIGELLEVMRRPYDEQPGQERFAARRPEWARHKVGCSMLSCSS